MSASHDELAPRTIWLQVGNEHPEDGVSWCDQQQEETDVKYIRADLLSTWPNSPTNPNEISRRLVVGPNAERHTDDEARELAKLFHDTYERLAPEFDYVTSADTRQFDVMSANGRLMIAVCREIIAKHSAFIERHAKPSSPATTSDDTALDKAADALVNGWRDKSPPNAAPDGWQPIETAPRDGSAVFAFWTQMQGGVVVPGCYGVTCFSEGTWCNPEDEDDQYSEPTHWQPLPAAPRGADTEKKG